MSSSPIAALEIGTTRTVLAVGELQHGGRIRVLGTAAIPTSGVRKSQIVDVSQASAAIVSALKAIEESASVNVNIAMLVVNGPHIQSSESIGLCQLESNTVTENDVSEVREKAQKLALAEHDTKTREVLQIFDLDFSVNDRPGILNPVGMSGQSLRHGVLAVHASKDALHDASVAAGEAKLDIIEPVFAGYAASLAVLSPQETRDGVLLLDMGGGSTSYSVFCDGHIVHAGVIGVGGDHVTNDIAMAFNCNTNQAERLKREHGSATVDASDAEKRADLPPSMPGGDMRTISVRALDTVINARMSELFTIILQNLDAGGFTHRLGAGVVLAGGGSALRNVEKLAARELGLATRIGMPVNVDGLENADNPAAFAAIAGALVYCGESERAEMHGGFGDLLGKIFGRLSK